jgi:hypothetical protein
VRITAVHIENFKRISDVRITPTADRAVILLGGKNRQGKTSALDALTAAFGGKRAQPADPVKHGADHAEISVELDGGDLMIRRVISPNGESVLEVRNRMGALKSPQAVLDELIGKRFLDPLAFLALPAKEQRAQLMRVIGAADRIAKLDEKRESAFTRRTEVGVELRRVEGELARIPPPAPAGTPIDVAAVAAERAAIEAYARVESDFATIARDSARDRDRRRVHAEAQRERVVHLESELRMAREVLATNNEQLAQSVEVVLETTAKAAEASAVVAAHAPRRGELDAMLASATAHNRAIAVIESAATRRAEAEVAAVALTTERETITKTLAAIDERKVAILAAAKLPVEGLGLDGDNITLGGVPLAQASGAERFRLALALAIVASPVLADVWIRDAAVLDDEALQLVAEQCAAVGKIAWLERVGTSDPGVIVISDGKVLADAEPAQVAS